MNLNEMRKSLLKKATASGRNPIEFNPPIGKSSIRFLPAINEDDMFYVSHAYHYFPFIGGGKYVYTHREYIVDGQRLKDPIDEAVATWYNLGKQNKDEGMLTLARTLKRKRHYFAHIILLDEEDPEKKYRVLVDTSNDAKIIRKVCVAMGLPFFIDTETNYVDKKTLEIDEDKEYIDLLSVESGRDYKIVKSSSGVNVWDISYEDSFAGKPRALTKEELVYLDQRIDLNTHIAYEENYMALKNILNDLIDSVDASDDKEEEVAGDSIKAEIPKETKEEAKAVVKDSKKKLSDEEIDGMLDDIDE